MLAENIKNARKNKGYTQEELAIRLNVVRQTVGKWEKGLSVPDADLLEKMANILETDVATLLGSTVKLDVVNDELSEQLARINEQLAIKNRRSRKLVKAIIITLISIIIISALAVMLQLFGSDRNGTDSKSPASVITGNELEEP